ncbi:hypothetical protein [Limisalsivibrio acetivorans]|uniref:hypothetical protein n=1 Tax=Limisalsivibrio acetivorans TaxID=1304888 RepID=UPI0003B7BB30|nr:hypothetical protein [Limisalsivibrio acetivorans]
MIKRLRGAGLLLCILIILSSCGYRIAGLGSGTSKYAYTLAAVNNRTAEPDLERIIEDKAVSFFSARGALGGKDRKRFNMEISLDRLSSSSNIVTETGQTGTSSMAALIEIKLSDGEEVVYIEDYSAKTTYDITSSISENRIRREAAIEEVIGEALQDFYDEYESK